MRHLTTLAAASALALAGGMAAQAEVTLDILYAQPGFAKFHEPIAKGFMEEHPDIRIEFRAPSKDYDEGHLLMQRLAVTNQLPDMYFPGYHLLAALVSVLEPRGQIVDLQPLLDQEPAEWITENYAQSMMDIGVVEGVKYGMAFNASLPIVYVNRTLVSEAGLDPDAAPDTWDGLIANAQTVHEAVPGAAGIGFTIYDWPDDWLWQVLLRQEGTSLVDPETGGPGFDNERGLAALSLLPRLVTEGGETLLEFEQARQQFAAGQTAYFIDTPARLAQAIDLVGDRFDLGTAKIPVNDKEAGGAPTGGAAAIITTTDPEKQAAAWEYVKYATGPEAQKVVVETTGYLPTNQLSSGPDYLGPFYEREPRFLTVASEMDLARPWEAYSRGEPVRIWRAQREIIGAVMRGDTSPEDGLKQLVETTNGMLK